MRLRGSPAGIFVSLNLDAPTPQIDKFVRHFQKEYSFPVLLGGSYFKLLTVPYTWILDEARFLRDVYAGAPRDWRVDTLLRVDAIRHRPAVTSLPPAVRESRRRLNEKEAARAIKLGN